MSVYVEVSTNKFSEILLMSVTYSGHLEITEPASTQNTTDVRSTDYKNLCPSSSHSRYNR
jgi:hypothetical protein